MPNVLRSVSSRLRCIIAAVLGLAGLGGAEGHDFKTVQPLLDRYCFGCHSGSKTKGDLDLSGYVHNDDYLASPDLLMDFEFYLAENEMPPPDAAAQPTAAERARMLDWTLALIHEVETAIPDDPGVVVMPRLTQDSYNRALSDLAGVSITPGDVLTTDAPAGEGFTNVGEAHTMEPTQLEKYLTAATEAMRHLRVSPVGGFTWYERPPQALDEPWRARKAALEAVEQWHHRRNEVIAQAPDRWYNDEGVGHGRYWWQAWRWKHRAELGIAGDDIAVLADGADRRYSPQALRTYWRFFTSEEIEDRVLRDLQARWAAVPGPRELDPEAALARMGEIEDWYGHFTAFTNDEPDIELKNRDVYGGKKLRELRDAERHPYRFQFDRYKGEGPIRELHLIVTDGTDGNDGDVIVWRNGRWLRGGNLTTKVADSTPWHETPGVELRTLDGKGVDWGSHPDGVAIGDDAVGVRAPQILVISVPQGYDGLELEVFIDPERYPQATVQTWVSPDIPTSAYGQAQHWIRGRGPTAGAQSGRQAKGMVDGWRDFLAPTSKYAIRHGGYFLQHHQELGPYFDTNMDRGDDVDLRLTRPYQMPLDLLLAETDEAALAEREARYAELPIVDQQPHQDLVRLFAGHGIVLQEGVAPTAEQMDALPVEARAAAEAIQRRIADEEAEFAEIARQQVADFTARAWRREPSGPELDALLEFYHGGRREGLSYEAAVKRALRATLCSPYFLYRHQRSQQRGDPYPIAPAGLADRLAAVLWGGLPDEELLAAAADGSLSEPEILAAQAERMLADERAAALAERFAGQWLGFAGFSENDNPDPARFEDFFDDEIAPLMEREATLFMDHLLRGGTPLTDLYRADYTFLNEELADFYGIDGVKGHGFRRVQIPPRRQGGALTLGAILTKSSTPLRTSAVVRGAWVLEQIVGEHLPEPPADVPDISDDETNDAGVTVAQQLAKHREDPACMGCHLRIDPLGIALEHFDPVGQWRSDFIDGTAVEADDTAVDGTEISGLDGLKGYIDARRDSVMRRFCHMFVGYALGRSVLPSDRPLIERMAQALADNDHRFEAALRVLVTSKQFRFRRDELAAAE